MNNKKILEMFGQAEEFEIVAANIPEQAILIPMMISLFGKGCFFKYKPRKV